MLLNEINQSFSHKDHSDMSIYRYLKCQPENPYNLKYFYTYVFCLYHTSSMILIIEPNLQLLIYALPSLEALQLKLLIYIITHET